MKIAVNKGFSKNNIYGTKIDKYNYGKISKKMPETPLGGSLQNSDSESG